MMNVCWVILTAGALAGTPAVASSFSECQIQATRGLATALLTDDVKAMSRAVAKQAQCRNLVTAEDEKQVELQNEMNKLIRDAVGKGSFDPL
jgi:hypothetical protein